MRIESYRNELPENVLSQIADIYIECFTGPPRFESWTAEKVKTHIRKFISAEADIYVVVEEDEIVSFGIGLPMSRYHNWQELIENGASKDAYYFAELATREAFRGKGYGRVLQEMRELAAKERGLSRLCVRVRADNETTINMIKKAGFAQVASYTGTIEGSVTERLVFEKSL